MQVKFVINTGKVINVIVEIDIDEIGNKVLDSAVEKTTTGEHIINTNKIADEIHEELAKWIDKNHIFRLIYQDVIDKSKVCDIQVY